MTEPDQSAEGRLAWLGRQWPITVVLVVAGIGLVVVAGRSFRPGCLLIAAALVLAALLRALLPDEAAGLLRLRSRVTDVAVLGVLGVGIGVLAVAVPR
ncbi:MAG TPA: DUF3017 domain-containing protein [Actinomycetes bacterium]|nr:DUF3017 domain-containing protein [Actinomycetes bacterium]